MFIAIMIPKTSRVDVPKFIYDPDAKTEYILTNIGLPSSAIEEFKNDPASFVWDEKYIHPETQKEINLKEGSLQRGQGKG